MQPVMVQIFSSFEISIIFPDQSCAVVKVLAIFVALIGKPLDELFLILVVATSINHEEEKLAGLAWLTLIHFIEGWIREMLPCGPEKVTANGAARRTRQTS